VTPPPTVRPLEARDFDAWLPLWEDYNAFYRNVVAKEVTQTTFRRLHEGADGFFGLVAEEAGSPAGLRMRSSTLRRGRRGATVIWRICSSRRRTAVLASRAP
jgi:hypothetical protein